MKSKTKSKRKTSAGSDRKKTKKPTSKKKPIQTSTKDDLTIGLLQHEIDQILGSQSKNETNKELEQAVMKELAKLLPEKEAITKETAAKHTSIIVQSIARRAEHSPYVLDLSALIEKKKKAKQEKHRVLSFFHHLHEHQPEATVQIREESPAAIAIPETTHFAEPTIVAEYENQIEFKSGAPKDTDFYEQFTKTPFFYHLNLPLRWHRTIIAYAAICLLIVTPIKVFGHYQEIKQSQDQIVSYATTAYEDLKIASQELAANNTAGAAQNFSQANHNFTQASQQIAEIDLSIKSILKILPTDQANLADAEYLLEAGQQISAIGQTLAQLFDIFTNGSQARLTDKIFSLQEKLEEIIPKLNQLEDDLAKVRIKAIPKEKQEQFEKGKEIITLLNNDVKEFNSFSKILNQLLGSDYKRRYLFVFQNNNEARPTGGFMGSFALVDIDRGQIKNIEIPGGGTYDLQGSLLEKRISPFPLHLINPLWEMQDANWFPDFPTSAAKTIWFYENSGGPTVDGVIAVNASLIPSLMQIIGPIDLPGYDKTFTSDNFIEELQRSIGIEYNNPAENKPKIILSDLAPKLLDKIFSADGEQLLNIAKTLKLGLAQNDIQLYFTNEAAQEKIASYGWTGQLLDTSKDYLDVINTNIGGGKTDGLIEQKIDIVSDIYDNGEIINTVTLTRKHTGKLSDPFGKVSNLSFARFYTPLGSQILSAQGFTDEILPESFEKPEDFWQEDEMLNQVQGEVWVEPDTGTYINNEFNKTVFGNWIQVDPGEETTVVLKYRLPFKINTNDGSGFKFFSADKQGGFHSLLLQKQSGQKNTKYSLTINLPEHLKPTWAFGDIAISNNRQILFESSSPEDQLIAFVYE